MARQRGIHPPKDDDELIGWWIDDYLDRTELGEAVTAADLCKDRPDLRPRLEAVLALVRG
jgi:hypothetical protein